MAYRDSYEKNFVDPLVFRRRPIGSGKDKCRRHAAGLRLNRARNRGRQCQCHRSGEANGRSALRRGAAELPFKGQHVVAYHDSWPYFAHRFGLEIDIFLEPKPGIPPSPSHLAEVIAQMKAQKTKAVIVEPYHDRKIAERVADATGAKVVDFAQYPGALPNTDNYVKLIDALVSRLT